MALFSNRRSTSNFLVEFRAGKMTMRGNTVYPDKRKGLVYVHQSMDSLMHFCWKDRGTGIVEDDLILFPEEVEFVSVPQCTTGRVFLLKFKNSSRKLFFWMQEPKADKDEEYCLKVNELLNRPPTAVPSGRKSSGRSTGAFQESFGDQLGIMNQLLSLGSRRDGAGSNASSDWHGGSMATMNQSQLMELLDLMGNGSQNIEITDMDQIFRSGSNLLPSIRGKEKPTVRISNNNEERGLPSSAEVASASSTGTEGDSEKPGDDDKTGKIALSDLRSVLASLNTRPKGKVSSTAVGRVPLEEVLVANRLEPIILTEENIQRLVAHLPKQSELSDKERLLENLTCPQFKQFLKLFSEALQSGQLGHLMKQFSFPPAVIEACNSGDIQKIAASLEQTASKNFEPAKKKKRDIDSDMELD